MSRATGRFRFDPITHTYWLGRTPLPSITQILAATAPSGPPPGYYTPETAARGTRIHAATARYDLGGGWGDDLIETDLPRVWAYAAFVEAMRPTYREIEQPRCSEAWRFAGTPDRLGVWRNGTVFVLDIKTGPPMPDHAMQLAAQVLVTGQALAICARYTLHLRDDGTYRLMRWDDPQDGARFLARLKTYTEGVRHGTGH